MPGEIVRTRSCGYLEHDVQLAAPSSRPRDREYSIALRSTLSPPRATWRVLPRWPQSPAAAVPEWLPEAARTSQSDTVDPFCPSSCSVNFRHCPRISRHTQSPPTHLNKNSSPIWLPRLQNDTIPPLYLPGTSGNLIAGVSECTTSSSSAAAAPALPPRSTPRAPI